MLNIFCSAIVAVQMGNATYSCVGAWRPSYAQGFLAYILTFKKYMKGRLKLFVYKSWPSVPLFLLRVLHVVSQGNHDIVDVALWIFQ